MKTNREINGSRG